MLKSVLSALSINNVFAGFIVAVVALPLCIAFAIASGANPMAGIISGVVGGLIAGAFGSSHFQVSGPAAAFITIIFGIIGQHGLPVLLASTFCAGVVVLAIAFLRLGRVMELMPHSVIVGFTSGIGVLILLGQIPTSLGITAKGSDVIEKLVYTAQHVAEGNLLELVVLLITVAAALTWGKTRAARWIPAPLVALGAGTAVSLVLSNAGSKVQTIGALYDISIASIGVSGDFLGTLAPHAGTVAMAGLTLGLLIAVESLLSAKALDAMTGTRHNPDRELIGLGLANLAVPFLGGLPTSGVIVRGSTNVMSGGTHKSAAIVHSLFLAAFVALLYSSIRLLPMASLAGVLVLTARRLIEVHELATIVKIDRWEGALAALTLLLTVTIDLTVSVPLGVGLMLVLALKRTLAENCVDVHEQRGLAVVAVHRSVTFLTASGIRRAMERHLSDDNVRVIDLLEANFMDSTGAMMIAGLLADRPQLRVWVAERRNYDRLAHAGVDASRMALLGNRKVNLPGVFERLVPAAG